MPRFILLEHSAAPDDPSGLHHDLLLEAGETCRTWRLVALPAPGGPPVAAEEIAPHRLAWLDHEAGEVSGGRGFARRVDGGAFAVDDEPPAGDGPAERLVVFLAGTTFTGTLVLTRAASAWTAQLLTRCT